MNNALAKVIELMTMSSLFAQARCFFVLNLYYIIVELCSGIRQKVQTISFPLTPFSLNSDQNLLAMPLYEHEKQKRKPDGFWLK